MSQEHTHQQPTQQHPCGYSAPCDPRYKYEDSLPSSKKDIKKEHKELLMQELTMWRWD